jgi:integrase
MGTRDKNDKPGRRKRAEYGQGSIYQDKDGQWWYAPPTIDGKRSSPIRCPSESAAKAKQREWLKARDHGVNPNDGRQSLQDFLTFWYNEASVPNVKPKTAHFYRQMIELYILPELGTIRLDKLQPEHVLRLLNNLRDDLSPRTIRHISSVLRQALDRAVKWSKLLYNPAAMVDPPKVTREEQTPLTPAQSGALLMIVEGHRLSALYHVALTLGPRKGELLGLRWMDLNWNAATLKITQQVLSIGSTTRFETPKSATSLRTLPLTAELIARLRVHWAVQQEERTLLDTRWSNHDLIFASEVGTPIIPRNLTRHFKRGWRKLVCRWTRAFTICGIPRRRCWPMLVRRRP